MRASIEIRALLAIGAAAILATVAGTVARGSAAAPRAAQMGGVWFVASYEGTLDATWRSSSPVVLPDVQHPFRCGGDDSSGQLMSSVRPQRKAFKVWIGHELGGRQLSIGFRPPSGMHTGVVTSNRTAQGFLMRYSGHQCVRYDIPQPGCGAHTVTTSVMPLDEVSGRFDSALSPVWHVNPSWPLEPQTIDCSDGIFFPTDYDYGWRAATLRAKQLYRCGMKKPRRCKMTIGRDRTYVFNQVDGGETYTTNLHVTWSITFAAAGKG
jgi:hypothetical protein